MFERFVSAVGVKRCDLSLRICTRAKCLPVCQQWWMVPGWPMSTLSSPAIVFAVCHVSLIDKENAAVNSISELVYIYIYICIVWEFSHWCSPRPSATPVKGFPLNGQQICQLYFPACPKCAGQGWGADFMGSSLSFSVFQQIPSAPGSSSLS